MKVVVDANVLVALVVPTQASTRAAEAFESWLTQEADLFAPCFWSYEAVSALRKFVASGGLAAEEALAAVTRLLSLGIQDVAATEELHHRALVWAERLKDFVAYDPAYLALSEHLEAAFWTADHKLALKVKALGVDWLHDLTA